MGELIGLQVDPGSKDLLVVEVGDDEPFGGLVLAAAPTLANGIAKAQVSLEEALDKLKLPLKKIAHMLKEVSPQEAEVEFGLKIGGETGVIVAKGTAEVNFVVRMTWRSGEGSRPGEVVA